MPSERMRGYEYETEVNHTTRLAARRSVRQFLINLKSSVRMLPALLKFIGTHGAAAFAIETQLTVAERMLLYRLARGLHGAPNLVEIGSYVGGSSQFLAAAASETDGRLYCIDTWQNDAMTAGARDTFDEFKNNVARYGDVVIPLRGRSAVEARKFNRVVDLLFIDGDHSYEAVKIDLTAWVHRLRAGAIVVFHDYGWAAGVQRAVQELVIPIELKSGSLVHSTYWTTIHNP